MIPALREKSRDALTSFVGILGAGRPSRRRWTSLIRRLRRFEAETECPAPDVEAGLERLRAEAQARGLFDHDQDSSGDEARPAHTWASTPPALAVAPLICMLMCVSLLWRRPRLGGGAAAERLTGSDRV
ncbi:hypothetical protein AB0K12_02135 [Nonomuraea sp. NPDC049419]|uniref:hypothetical protein n=1 Tax=Nonomuraea sp. NPDC049419 TaxID=3155772 RepID=UPI003440CF4C